MELHERMTQPPETCQDCCQTPALGVWLCKKHAAAPALLEALRICADAIEDHYPDKPDYYEGIDKAARAARAAIAQTTDTERE